MSYPVRDNRSNVVPSNATLPGSFPFWQRDRFHSIPTPELESFFQTWLFFGLINEFLKGLCNADDFIKQNKTSGTTSLSTSRLFEFADSWVEQVQNGMVSSSYEHFAECLSLNFPTLRMVSLNVVRCRILTSNDLPMQSLK